MLVVMIDANARLDGATTHYFGGVAPGDATAASGELESLAVELVISNSFDDAEWTWKSTAAKKKTQNLLCADPQQN